MKIMHILILRRNLLYHYLLLVDKLFDEVILPLTMLALLVFLGYLTL